MWCVSVGKLGTVYFSSQNMLTHLEIHSQVDSSQHFSKVLCLCVDQSCGELTQELVRCATAAQLHSHEQILAAENEIFENRPHVFRRIKVRLNLIAIHLAVMLWMHHECLLCAVCHG